MKSLAKDTAIYGVSTIFGRFLNWLLVPMYTFYLKNTAEYGIITNLYAWTAILLVILTYGMETGLFRFMNNEKEDPTRVYSTSVFSLAISSLIFAVITILFATPIANALGYEGYSEYIWMLGVIVAVDAFTAIPSAYLRYKKRPIRFALIKLIMIAINIVLNVFFIILCPLIWESYPETISWFYSPSYSVGYILIANVVSTAAVLFLLIPEIKDAKWLFDKAIFKRMIAYSAPLLLLGIAGMLNQTVDKIIFPMVYPDAEKAKDLLGIYGACFKVAMVMMMFTQAFRFAYEPFVFAQHKDKNSKEAYADAMKYFLIISLLIFLGMMFYVDILKYIISEAYWEGLQVVPIVLMGFLFQGVFFNLSLWYKLIDKTQYGAYLSIIGTVITVLINVLFIPIYGYMAAAWASFICYLVIMLLSYFLGQKYFPIDYQLKRIGLYSFLTLVLYVLNEFLHTSSELANYSIKTLALIGFILFILKKEKLNERIPMLNRILK